MPEVEVIGTTQEKKVFTEVLGHYQLAKRDLETRIPDFDKKDVLFRSHISEDDWPYKSLVFDPRVFTFIFEKTARLFANKPRGRLVPREGGDSLGAVVNNELLSFQWDDNERAQGSPMLAKWATMDQNARKYGAAFGLAKWKWQRQVVRKKGKGKKATGKSRVFYDGPDFEALNNRDCLPNPSYSTVKNWFQHREYVTFQDLADVNDSARTEAVYKNLDLLRLKLKEESKQGGDTRSSNYTVKNLDLKGLEDFLGQDEVFRTIELVTEYRDSRWITFSPRHGVVLRDIPNPYDHGQIPVVMLKYYPIDDDLYGLSEIEPIEKLQKATNALICQYIDAINMSLYTPLKVRQTGGAVQRHTLNFGPGEKWLMNDPQTDVIAHDQGTSGVTEFTSTYRFLIGAMQEALGETSAAVSNLNPGAEGKTATEIRDLALTRSARDNYNQIYLAEAMKKQMGFWFLMNQQLLFSGTEQQKIIRIVGKEAIKYFQKMGVDGNEVPEDVLEGMTDEDMLEENFNFKDFEVPQFPVTIEGEQVPKFAVSDDGQTGNLVIEPEDLAGMYDYIPDLESMELPNEQQSLQNLRQAIELASNPAAQQLLAQDQYTLKFKDLIEDYFEKLGLKDADKYFEKAQEEGGLLNGQVEQGGAATAEAGAPGLANGGNPGLQGGPQALPGNQVEGVIS